MTNENDAPAKSAARTKATYLPRIMPAGAAVILLMILIPLLRDRKAAPRPPGVEPPLAMSIYSTGHARLDSLANEGLRRFGGGEYEHAARLLAEAHFHWNVRVHEGVAERFPDDLRFYFGLAQFYRGHPAKGAPLIEDEERENPHEGKYAWYLAHIYESLGRRDEARAKLERAAELGGEFADEAREALGRAGERAPAEGAP